MKTRILQAIACISLLMLTGCDSLPSSEEGDEEETELAEAGGKSTAIDDSDTVEESTSQSSTDQSGAEAVVEEVVAEAPSGRCSSLEGDQWLHVAANADVGQNNDFYVMKFEAKEKGSSVEARAEDAPMVVWYQSAKSLCEGLGAGYELMTNPQWQTIAREIETATDGSGNYYNWEGGSPDGESILNRGNFDGDGLMAADPYETEHEKERCHTLASGEEIWDFSGNANEWVVSPVADNGKISHYSDTLSSAMNYQQSWVSLLSGEPNFFHTIFGPEGDYSDKGSRGGLGVVADANAQGRAMTRGGAVGFDLVPAGIFAANFNALEATSSSSNPHTGFRCTYTPQ